MANNSLIQVISFLFVVELIGLSAFPFAVKIFPWSLGYTFSISRIFGQILLGSILWSLVSVGLITASSLYIFLSLSLVFILGCSYSKNWIYYLKQESLSLAAAYYLTLILFLSCRYLHPEIHWGEKPMDFTFLNYFSRLESLPPTEPWASGLTMHYYYGGYFLFSAILRLANVNADVGYNLIVSLIPALYLSGLYGVFRVFTLSHRFSLFSASLVALASDPEMLFSIIRELRIDSHLFWASTRVYPSPGFTEYPFWTFIFADLHPHFMALPFVVFFILLLSTSTRNGFGLIQKILLGLTLALILLTNAWDAIACSLLLAFFWLSVGLLYPLTSGPSFRPFVKFVFDSILFLLILCAFCLPVAYSLRSSNTEINLIWASTDEFHSLLSIFKVMGLWLIPLAFCVCFSISEKVNYKTFLLNSLMIICLAMLLGVSQFYHNNILPWPLLSFFYVLLLGYGLSKFSDQVAWPQLSILSTFTFTFFIVVELLVLIDRMNSVFKFHYFLWTCFGIQALVFIYFCSKQSKWFSYSLLIPISIIAILGSFSSLWLGYSQGFHWNLTAVKMGLNGFSYYNDYNYKDAEMITWLRSHASPGSVMIEAHGPSYQDYSRISSNTGLPTVLGWDYHVSQRGVSQIEIQNRKTALKTIYQNKNLDLVCSLLKNYKVNYLVLGDLERTTYQIGSATELESAKCLKVMYRTGSSFVAAVL